MHYLKLVDGIPEEYSVQQLKKDNPNVSFPEQLSSDLLSTFSVYTYNILPIPEHDTLTEVATEGSFEKSSEGAWVLSYKVTQLPKAIASEYVRQKRNMLLQQSDWMALSDVTMPPSWVLYRQALRDITAQPTFPYGVVWPNKPE